MPSPSFIFIMGFGTGWPDSSLERVVRPNRYCWTVDVVPGTMYFEMSALLWIGPFLMTY